jgi:callose synthase
LFCAIFGDQNLTIKLLLISALVFTQVFTFSQKSSVNFQMFLRLIQGTVFVVMIVSVVLVVVLTNVSVGDLFASLLAILPTGWGILSVSTFPAWCISNLPF